MVIAETAKTGKCVKIFLILNSVVQSLIICLTQLLVKDLLSFRPNLMPKLVHGLAFGTPKFYIAPYDKINHRLVNLSCKCDVKSGLKGRFLSIL